MASRAEQVDVCAADEKGNFLLISSLKYQIREALREVVQDSVVGFVDHPLSMNSGDAAIYAGTQICLKEAGLRQAYVSHLGMYDREALKKALPKDGTILIQGGGNWGDLWPSHQELRYRLLLDFPHNPIVQLPQSIYFSNAAERRRSARAVGRHPNVTLMVRDQRSLSIATDLYGDSATVILVPDMAFGLGPIKLDVAPHGIECIIRSDHESVRRQWPASSPEVRVRDWHRSFLTRVDLRLLRKSVVGLRAGSDRIDPGYFSGNGAYALFAKQALQPALIQVARAEVVVTDRLHGHILSTLLGRPHVVVSEKSDKIEALVKTWTRYSELVHVAGTADEALHIAEKLLAEGRQTVKMPA